MSELDPDVLQSLQSWWQYVWGLKREDIGAGKVVQMFDPWPMSVFRGADNRLSRLYVRRMFGPLFDDICYRSGYAVGDWICHINGNSGVGKSAFLWYFIVRTVVEFGDSDIEEELHILYESGGYIWEFQGNTVHVAKRDKFTGASFAKASWHLINQKVPETGAIGRVVVLAASPAKANVQAAKPDRKKTVLYMYPWEEDEYAALVELWKSHYEKLAAEMETLKGKLRSLETWANVEYKFGSRLMVSLGSADLSQVPKLIGHVEQLLQGDARSQTRAARQLAFTLQQFIKVLELQGQDGSRRIKAASEYYQWFGGVVRLLWSDQFEKLNSEGLLKSVRDSLKKTNLLQLLETVQDDSQDGENISSALLHFLKLDKSTPFLDYHLDFCSVKVQAEFTLALTRKKALDLELFMQTASDIPEYGVLRGFVFEELSISYVLHGSTHSMTPMVDDKHCGYCKSREDPSRGKSRGQWIACDVCQQWYHFRCAGVTKKPELQLFWQCPSCKGAKSEERLEPRRLLRYYEGDLQTALLEAGAGAIDYVWRPVIKNNGAVDYIILPGILAQPTVASRHAVAAEALKSHIKALRAWNDKYGGTRKPEEYVLCFFLAESNYDAFGFQSFRDRSRRVTKQAVRGIRQCKVLLRHNVPVPCAQEMKTPKDVEIVDHIEQCEFDGEMCEASFFDPAEELLRYEEAATNKKRKLAFESACEEPGVLECATLRICR